MKTDIRTAEHADIPLLYKIATAMGQRHEEHYFERCLDEQGKGNRILFIAGEYGYVQLVWQSLYPLFRRMGLPEIQDLNVIPDARQQGIGAALVTKCEELAREKGCTDIGISVGLHSRFGAAQRLYVRSGYVPDGAGIAYDEVTVMQGELRPVDDMLTLKLVKKLA